MTETLAYVYSSEEYQHDRVWIVINSLCSPCPLDKSSLSLQSDAKEKTKMTEKPWHMGTRLMVLSKSFLIKCILT